MEEIDINATNNKLNKNVGIAIQQIFLINVKHCKF